MILVTKASVTAALEAWFIAARSGTTMSAQDTAALSAADAAAASADFLYQALLNNAPTQGNDGPPLAPGLQAIEDDLFN